MTLDSYTKPHKARHISPRSVPNWFTAEKLGLNREAKEWLESRKSHSGLPDFSIEKHPACRQSSARLYTQSWESQ
jgi:hypothetical protein